MVTVALWWLGLDLGVPLQRDVFDRYIGYGKPANVAKAKLEFADAMPQPLGWGMRHFGGRFLKEYPFTPGYLLDTAVRFRERLALPIGTVKSHTSRALSSLRRTMREVTP